MNQWLGRAVALVEATGNVSDTIALKTAVQFLAAPPVRELNAQHIAATLYAALAKAELKAPAAVQETFIAAAHTFDAFAAVSAADRLCGAGTRAGERAASDRSGLLPKASQGRRRSLGGAVRPHSIAVRAPSRSQDTS
jgi:hypothetical protein